MLFIEILNKSGLLWLMRTMWHELCLGNIKVIKTKINDPPKKKKLKTKNKR